MKYKAYIESIRIIEIYECELLVFSFLLSFLSDFKKILVFVASDLD